MTVLLALVACGGTVTVPDGPDLTEVLGQDEARAGVVTDDAAFFGGVSAEGQVGDIKIYNDRVQFIIQGLRDGHYYVGQSGGVVDADIVRPAGQPGRDLVDDWGTTVGVGRVLDAASVAVASDGSLGGPAIVVVEGIESTLELVSGALESDSLFPDLGLSASTAYVLHPGSWLMEVHTTITASEEALVEPGDLLMGSLDAASPFHPGVGFDAMDSDTFLSVYVGNHNEVAVGVLADADSVLRNSAGAELLAELAELVGGSGEAITLAAGESLTYSRFYGVAPDVATLSSAWLERSGEATSRHEGTVTAPDGTVAGARVHVFVDGAPYTLAFTRDDGSFEVDAPASGTVTLLAEGRGTGRFNDLPEGAGSFHPYTASVPEELALASVASGAEPVPCARGRGVATDADPLTLGEPGRVLVSAVDGLPFEVRLAPVDADPEVPDVVMDRPSGYQAIGWGRDGAVELVVEAGTYALVAHRGLRYEVHEETVSVDAGGQADVVVDLGMAYAHDGFLLADPHTHAAPSGDGQLPMEDRLIVTASLGIQLHFGTDHDHIADYRPLLEPLGLDGVLRSVVSNEISPVLRGHVNSYPLIPDDSLANHGAWAWWSERVETTAEQFGLLRQRHPDALLQINHPLDSGMPAAAGWTTGVIGNGDFWTDDFDAVEVLNAGDYEEYLAFYFDAFHRGVLSTPIGVSDSHGHTSGDVGVSATFLGIGDSVADYSDDALREAMKARRTVVTRGPFIDLSVDPGTTVSFGTTIDVEVRSPSWIVVDTVRLLRDGEEVEAVAGVEASFTLAPDADAAYVVVADGTTPMGPVYGNLTPWAMTSPVLVDVDGDGWDPPLPGLQVY